jgi:CheY-like chemotaxis protein
MQRRQPISYVDPENAGPLEIKEEIEATATRPAGKVLLLEDRDDFREVLQEHLSLRGYEVTSASNGAEGLREVQKSVFDLIICDMIMPQVGGEMFYWAVTRVRSAAGQRFIFFTGHQANPAIEFFFQRVNATVLRKPFKLAELDSAIREVFRKLG